MWGNGADFDNVALSELYRAFDMRVPWPGRANRCFRTMRFEWPASPQKKNGKKHNALADAVHQAEWLGAIYKELKKE